MTLARFRGSNYPQQLAKRGPRPEVDDRQTSPETFNPLHARFHFTIDVAASAANAKLPRYFTIEDDGLSQPWTRERVWCNPPYSSIEPWVAKAWQEWKDLLSGPHLIVMLLPANRTEQGWWHRWVEPHLRSRRVDFRCEFLPGRVRFIAPGATGIGPNERPPFGSCLLIWGDPR